MVSPLQGFSKAVIQQVGRCPTLIDYAPSGLILALLHHIDCLCRCLTGIPEMD